MPKKEAIGDNGLVDPALKKTFLEMRDHWQTLNERANSATGKRRQYEKEIKEAGFKIQMVKDSLLLATPEGEQEFRAEIANRLLAAAYSDASVGDQLSLFLEPDRTPATERAAKEGETAAMRNEAHNPPYDPSVPQYKAWSDAFYAEQERQVLAGIGKLDKDKADENAKPKKGRPAKGANADAPEGSERTLITKEEKAARAAALADAKAKDAAPPRKPKAAEPVTRASLAAQRAAAKEKAESYFTRSEPAGNA